MKTVGIVFVLSILLQGWTQLQESKELARLVQELSDEDPDVRDKAEFTLKSLAPSSIQTLKELLQKGNVTIEARTRLEKIIKQCEEERELNESLPEMKVSAFQLSDEPFKNAVDKLNKTFGTAVAFTFDGIGDSLKVSVDCRGNFYQVLEAICKASGKATFACEAHDKITILPATHFKPVHSNTAYGRIEVKRFVGRRECTATKKKHTAELSIGFFRPDFVEKILSVRFDVKSARSPDGEVQVLRETEEDNFNNVVKIGGGGQVIIRGGAVRGLGFQQNEPEFNDTIHLELPWDASSLEVELSARIAVKTGEKSIEINLEKNPADVEADGVVYSFDKNSDKLEIKSNDNKRSIEGLVDESSIVYVNSNGEEKKFPYVSMFVWDWGDDCESISYISYKCHANPASEIRTAKSVKLKTRMVRVRITDNVTISVKLAGK